MSGILERIFNTFINNLGNYLTKLQIKIVSLIDKDSLWHDYLGSWIMLVMFGYCILFKVDIYLIPISVILAGISKECIDKYYSFFYIILEYIIYSVNHVLIYLHQM